MKDFDGWNERKKAIQENSPVKFCYPREIWWCSIGVNVGDEQDGTGDNFDRPVVVIRGFNERIFLAVPLVGKRKAGRFYFPLGFIGNREATAVLSQVRLLDTRRLTSKMTMLPEEVFKKMKSALFRALFDEP